MKNRHFFALLTLAITLAACNLSLAADVTPPPDYQPPEVAITQPELEDGPYYPLVPPDPAQGKTTYIEECAPCHGENGLGNGPRAADLPNPVLPLGDAQVAHQTTPASWFRMVSQGNLERFMPPFPNLSEYERWNVIAYAISLSVSPDSLSEGMDLYYTSCAACHGARGQGNGPDAASLDATLPNFTDQEYMANESDADFFAAITQGVPPVMPAYADQMSEEQRWALTNYLRSLSFSSSMASAPTQASPGWTPYPDISTPTPAITGTTILSPTLTTGVITGVVINPLGKAITPGLTINLHGFDNMQRVITETTPILDDGSFTFPNVDMPEGRTFFATVEYQDALYASEIVQIPHTMQSLELPIQVFESTRDISALSIDRLHFFLDVVDEQTLRVGELYIISNPGDKTVLPNQPDQPVLSFDLPPGATNLQIQDEMQSGRFIPIETGLGVTSPITPGAGNLEVFFVYDLPYSRKVELSRTVKLPTEAVIVLVPAGNIRVKSSQLQDLGERSNQGVEYQMYSGGSLDPGQSLKMTITGKPTSNLPSLKAGSNTSLIIGAAALGLALLVAVVWLSRRKQLVAAEEDSDETSISPISTIEDDPDAIMDAILALDDQFQEGRLPEEAYLKRRAELKARLRQLTGN